ncbi:hypothetical protein ACFQY0_02720 [Haloferula chungangensis]|uniref:DUF4175 domain-containing protein n=1 Tax=Haloferula chungangensis TaxID=1048331 RepID=A0ABW2L3M3_9BACT
MEPTNKKLQNAWSREADRVSRRVNLGWWIESLTAPLVVVGLIGAFVLLLVRREIPGTPVWQLAAGIALVLLALAGIAWAIARARFENRQASMVRIEAAMHLRNGLSAASAGVRSWPEVPVRVDAGLSWNWQRLVIPPLAALLFLMAGLFIPVSALPGGDGKGPQEPDTWKQVEADLERLGEDEMIDETYLEEMKKKLEELRAKEEEEWFSHSSLEATDSLKKQHQSELQRFERDLNQAEKALGNLQKNAGGMPQERKDQLMNQFDQALQGLQNGGLKPNPGLLEQLKQLDPNNLGQLNPEQLQQLRENMQKAGQACKDCNGGGQGNGWMDELLDGQGNGQGEGEGKGEGPPRSGEGPGNGGVDRGPGHAPGVLGKRGEMLKGGNLEALEAQDLSRTLPGDLLQLQDGEHHVDESATGSSSGGGIQSTGAGGDRVWKESLDPEEQKALKKFFE